MNEEIIEKNGKKYKVIELIEEPEELFFGKYTIDNIQDALKDESCDIRIEAYRILGFNEDALKDEDEDIRYEAYSVLGFTKDAFKDENWYIRLEAYRTIGFTKDALKDEYWEIRQEAELYFKIKKALEKKKNE